MSMSVSFNEELKAEPRNTSRSLISYPLMRNWKDDSLEEIKAECLVSFNEELKEAFE